MSVGFVIVKKNQAKNFQIDSTGHDRSVAFEMQSTS